MQTELAITLLGITLYCFVANYLSYTLEKKKILESQKWDLNICCGKTDGGGLNVDIFMHKDLPRFQLVGSIYNLPFENGAFESVLCSHTMEHVEDPERFFAELQRVGKTVTLVVPPLYDLAAVLNIVEHKWIFLTFRKKHHSLPNYIQLPFALHFQERFGQRVKA
jgi:SAM-dependent methyltransferase